MESTAIGRSSHSNHWQHCEIFRLIELVRANEAIYNPNQKNYSCRPFVENFWKEVDIRFGKNPGSSLAKWTNLRATFRKEYAVFHKQNVNSSWAYFNEMCFIQKYLRKRLPLAETEGLESRIKDALEQINNITRRNTIISGNCSAVEVADTTQTEESICEDIDFNAGRAMSIKTEALQKQCLQNEVKSEGSLEDVKQEDFQSDPDINERDYSRSSWTSADDEYLSTPGRIPIDEKVSYPVDTTTKLYNNYENGSVEKCKTCKCMSDPDAMFLMSLLPDIQSLPKKDKGKFKIEVQKVIQKFLYPCDDLTTI